MCLQYILLLQFDEYHLDYKLQSLMESQFQALKKVAQTPFKNELPLSPPQTKSGVQVSSPSKTQKSFLKQPSSLLDKTAKAQGREELKRSDELLLMQGGVSSINVNPEKNGYQNKSPNQLTKRADIKFADRKISEDFMAQNTPKLNTQVPDQLQQKDRPNQFSKLKAPLSLSKTPTRSQSNNTGINSNPETSSAFAANQTQKEQSMPSNEKPLNLSPLNRPSQLREGKSRDKSPRGGINNTGNPSLLSMKTDKSISPRANQKLQLKMNKAPIPMSSFKRKEELKSTPSESDGTARSDLWKSKVQLMKQKHKQQSSRVSNNQDLLNNMRILSEQVEGLQNAEDRLLILETESDFSEELSQLIDEQVEEEHFPRVSLFNGTQSIKVLPQASNSSHFSLMNEIVGQPAFDNESVYELKQQTGGNEHFTFSDDKFQAILQSHQSQVRNLFAPPSEDLNRDYSIDFKEDANFFQTGRDSLLITDLNLLSSESYRDKVGIMNSMVDSQSEQILEGRKQLANEKYLEQVALEKSNGLVQTQQISESHLNLSSKPPLAPQIAKQSTFLMAKQSKQDLKREQIEREVLEELSRIQAEVEINYELKKYYDIELEGDLLQDEEVSRFSKPNLPQIESLAPFTRPQHQNQVNNLSPQKHQQSNSQSEVQSDSPDKATSASIKRRLDQRVGSQSPLEMLDSLISEGMRVIDQEKRKLNFDQMKITEEAEDDESLSLANLDYYKKLQSQLKPQSLTPNKSSQKKILFPDDEGLKRTKKQQAQSKMPSPSRALLDDRDKYQRKGNKDYKQVLFSPKGKLQLNNFSIMERENNAKVHSASKQKHFIYAKAFDSSQLDSSALFISATCKLTFELLTHSLFFDNSLADTIPLASYLVSDYELVKGDRVFLQMISAQPRCHEALFGLGKNCYCRGELKESADYLRKAVAVKRGVDGDSDQGYQLWLGHVLLMQGLHLADKIQQLPLNGNSEDQESMRNSGGTNSITTQSSSKAQTVTIFLGNQNNIVTSKNFKTQNEVLDALNQEPPRRDRKEKSGSLRRIFGRKDSSSSNKNQQPEKARNDSIKKGRDRKSSQSGSRGGSLLRKGSVASEGALSEKDLLVQERDLLFGEAAKYISKCTQIGEGSERLQMQSAGEKVIAAFEMLKLVIVMRRYGVKLSSTFAPFVREPEHYANLVKGIEQQLYKDLSLKEQSQKLYYGYLAWSLVYLYLDSAPTLPKGGVQLLDLAKSSSQPPEKAVLGQDALRELMSLHPQKLEAYLALWSYYKFQLEQHKSRQNNNQVSTTVSTQPASPQKIIDSAQQGETQQQLIAKQADVAERLFIFATDFRSYHDKLLGTVVYAQTLFQTKDYYKLFTLLQLEYSKAPHYTSLLYLYGKSVVRSKQLEFYGSGLGALEEAARSCLPHLHPNSHYYRGLGYLELGNKVKAFKCFQQYFLAAQDKVPNSKLGQIVSFQKKIDSQLFKSFIKISEQVYSARIPLDERTKKEFRDFNLFHTHQKVLDYAPEDAAIFKAVFQYKVYGQVQESDQLFQQLLGQNPKNLDVLLAYLEFLMAMQNHKGALVLCDKISHLLDSETATVSTNEWLSANLKMAEAYSKAQRLEEAVEVLLKLRSVLPPIDLVQIADQRLLPFEVEEYREETLSVRNQVRMDDGGLGLFKTNLFESSREENKEVPQSQEEDKVDELAKYLQVHKSQSEASLKEAHSLGEGVESQRELSQEQIDKIKRRMKLGIRAIGQQNLDEDEEESAYLVGRGLQTIDEKEDEELSRSYINPNFSSTLIRQSERVIGGERNPQGVSKQIYQSVLSLERFEDQDTALEGTLNLHIESAEEAKPTSERFVQFTNKVLYTSNQIIEEEDSDNQTSLNTSPRKMLNRLASNMETQRSETNLGLQKSYSHFLLPRNESQTSLRNLRRSSLNRKSIQRDDGLGAKGEETPSSSQLIYFDRLLQLHSNGNYLPTQNSNDDVSAHSYFNKQYSHRSSVPKVARISSHRNLLSQTKLRESLVNSKIIQQSSSQLNEALRSPSPMAFDSYSEQDRASPLDDNDCESDLKDAFFSVCSDAGFLLRLAKLGKKSTANMLFADIALWSLYDYLLVLTYYRDFEPYPQHYETKRLKVLLSMAELLLQCEGSENAERIINEIYEQCIDRRDKLFLKTQELYSQIIRSKGMLKPEKIITNYFHP